MKIVILGTSNSVMGQKGFVRALRQRHEVVNLSAGRVGVAFHLNRIIEHYEMIESADLLIIDHYINDVNGFGPHLGDQYISDLNVLFDCLRCMNTHVINLLFPFIAKEHMDLGFYDVAVEGMRARNLSFVDLNEIGFKRQHFLDEIHLTTGASYLMGMTIAREIARLENVPKPSGGAIHENPFKRYTISKLIPDRPCLHHQNRPVLALMLVSLQESRLHVMAHMRPDASGVKSELDRTLITVARLTRVQVGICLRAPMAKPWSGSPTNAEECPPAAWRCATRSR